MASTKIVSVPRSGPGPLEGYLAVCAEMPAPTVQVVHELLGLNENIREVSERFAESGYVALAVNLFSGAPRPVCMARLLAAMLRNGHRPPRWDRGLLTVGARPCP